MLRSGLGDHTTLAVQRGSRASLQYVRSRVRGYAGGPDRRPRVNVFRAPRACGTFERYPIRVDRRHANSDSRTDAQMHQRTFRGGRELLGERRQYAGRAFEQQYPRLLGMNRAKIVAQRVARNFSEYPSQFHPGRAGAHDHEGQPCEAARGSGSRSAASKAYKIL